MSDESAGEYIYKTQYSSTNDLCTTYRVRYVACVEISYTYIYSEWVKHLGPISFCHDESDVENKRIVAVLMLSCMKGKKFIL